jgi:prophage DNA circulation protein
VLGRNLEASADAMRSWSAQASGRTEAAATLADRVASLSASATGAGGAVRATVAGSGILTGLELGEVKLTGADLAAEIIRVMRRAQAGLVERVTEAVDETVGADTDTGRAVLDSFAQRFPAEPEAAPVAPVMPSPPPFPTFESRPSLPHQALSGGFESGRDSRAR